MIDDTVIKVLVVDDDVRVADVNAAYVAKIPGFHVAAKAHSAGEALRLVEETPVDLVLLDHYLPDETGLSVVRTLRERGHQTDVIMVTAARDVATVQAAMRHGALQYLVKPFSYAGLRAKLDAYATLRRTLDGGGEAEQAEVDRIFGALSVDPRPRAAQGPLPHHRGTGTPRPDGRGRPPLRPGAGRPHPAEPPDGPALPEAPGTHGPRPPKSQVRRNRSPGASLRVGGERLAASGKTSARHVENR